ncbi:Hypothetical predicted protein [Podarcis lilfordi]|uniref:Uncharacterized protein n=1 Tax=Podarcis lilfordi TaxID=74358 RepID=A0AA35PQ20_9SAUR|nr:Hypothetical predicted protein [Podarcis lilfordi]
MTTRDHRNDHGRFGQRTTIESQSARPRKVADQQCIDRLAQPGFTRQKGLGSPAGQLNGPRKRRGMGSIPNALTGMKGRNFSIRMDEPQVIALPQGAAMTKHYEM